MRRISEILDYEQEQNTETKGMYQEIEKINADIELKCYFPLW